MAFKAINDFIGLDSLIFILLVFRSYPQMIEFDTPLPIIIWRVIAFKKAIKKVKKIQAKY